jgi:hypothetical protein
MYLVFCDTVFLIVDINLANYNNYRVLRSIFGEEPNLRNNIIKVHDGYICGNILFQVYVFESCVYFIPIV